MKKIIFTMMILSGSLSLACFQKEAQVIGQIKTHVKVTSNTCHVFLESLNYYSENQLCALDAADILSKGVQVHLRPGESCETLLEVNGVLIQRDDGEIIKEN